MRSLLVSLTVSSVCVNGVCQTKYPDDQKTDCSTPSYDECVHTTDCKWNGGVPGCTIGDLDLNDPMGTGYSKHLYCKTSKWKYFLSRCDASDQTWYYNNGHIPHIPFDGDEYVYKSVTDFKSAEWYQIKLKETDPFYDDIKQVKQKRVTEKHGGEYLYFATPVGGIDWEILKPAPKWDPSEDDKKLFKKYVEKLIEIGQHQHDKKPIPKDTSKGIQYLHPWFMRSQNHWILYTKKKEGDGLESFPLFDKRKKDAKFTKDVANDLIVNSDKDLSKDGTNLKVITFGIEPRTLSLTIAGTKAVEMYWESQEGSLCGQHSLNNAVQEPVFTCGYLDGIARKLHPLLPKHDNAVGSMWEGFGWYTLHEALYQKKIQFIFIRFKELSGLETVFEDDINMYEIAKKKTNVLPVAIIIEGDGHWISFRHINSKYHGFDDYWVNLNSASFTGPEIITAIMDADYFVEDLHTVVYGVTFIYDNSKKINTANLDPFSLYESPLQLGSGQKYKGAPIKSFVARFNGYYGDYIHLSPQQIDDTHYGENNNNNNKFNKIKQRNFYYDYNGYKSAESIPFNNVENELIIFIICILIFVLCILYGLINCALGGCMVYIFKEISNKTNNVENGDIIEV